VLEFTNKEKKGKTISELVLLPCDIASTDDLHCYMLAPMGNFVGIDELYKGFGVAINKMEAET
jgi:hypothetical protein